MNIANSITTARMDIFHDKQHSHDSTFWETKRNLVFITATAAAVERLA
jgi:hypothetical protein